MHGGLQHTVKKSPVMCFAFLCVAWMVGGHVDVGNMYNKRVTKNT